MGWDFNPFTNRLDNTGDGLGTELYFTTSGISPSDPAVDGAWRLRVSGNNFVMERRESGVYVEKTAATP